MIAYCALLLGIPAACSTVMLTLDGTCWPRVLLYAIPAALFTLFTAIVVRSAPVRRWRHLLIGLVLLPIIWLLSIMISGAIMITPATRYGIQ
jgi:hypothetical protein